MGVSKPGKTRSNNPEPDYHTGGMRALLHTVFPGRIRDHRLFSPHNVDGDEIVGILRSGPVILCANFFSSVLLAIGLWGHVDTGPLLAWLVVVWAICACMFIHWLKAPRPHVSGGSGTTGRLIIVFSALAAAPWGWLPLAYIGAVPAQLETLIFAVSAGMLASGAFMLIRFPAAVMTYMLTVTLPLILKCVMAGAPHHLTMAAIVLAYLVLLTIMIVRQAEATFDRESRIRTVSAVRSR